MLKQETANTFQDGMVMDFNPLTTPNSVVTNCLNGTIVTFNGNEHVLQNDMGNGRVETAYLPEGYIPMGTAELGGIIYIVSYNPITNKSQIGCFPSPERNITTDEISNNIVTINPNQLCNNGTVVTTVLRLKLLPELFKLNPGDKYVIYSPNNGITKNSNVISDVNSNNCIVDANPKNVTIHVVAIGDDGKIVYLDNTLKWGGDLNYYIKELKSNNDTIQKDIDSYRSLVTSPYNIFNSKVSGELALLFELKVIDTFSATWDANVIDINPDFNGCNKKAIISFDVNYTSKHKNINPNYVIITDSNFNNNSPFINNHWDLTDFINNRENDNDTNVKLTVSNSLNSGFKFKSNDDLSNYIWKYKLTPAMKFGKLNYLSVNGSINFKEIGSGNITINSWKYFILDDNFYLNFGIEAYPEKNKKIYKVILTFIPSDEIINSNIITDDNKEYNKEYNQDNEVIRNVNTFYQHELSNQISYSGYFLEVIDFEKESLIQNKKLSKDKLYLVDICICYGDDEIKKYKHNYKWLYTTGQWNEKFKSENDFSNLILDDVISFKQNFNIEDNIEDSINITQSKLNISKNLTEIEQFTPISSLIMTVNYNDNGNFTNNPNVIINSTVDVTVNGICSKLFTFNQCGPDEFNLIEGNISIDVDADSAVESDTSSSLAIDVRPKKMNDLNSNLNFKSNISTNLNNTNNLNELEDSITTIKDEGINDLLHNNKAIDTFGVSINKNKNQYKLSVKGVIFSKINADYINKNIEYKLMIRPVLLKESELAGHALKMNKLENKIDILFMLDSIFYEDHWDSEGNSFVFNFGNRRDSNPNKGWGSLLIEANKGDKGFIGDWLDFKPYNDSLRGLNQALCKTGGDIHILKFCNTRSNTTTKYLNGDSLNGHFIMWVRTDKERFIPIGDHKDSGSINADNPYIDKKGVLTEFSFNYAKLIAQLYYIDKESKFIKELIVTNINYANNYDEIWNINLKSKLKISDCRNSIKVGNYSLSNLQIYLQNKGINFANIGGNNTTYNFENTENILISHKFHINNRLYDFYENAKNINKLTIAYLSHEVDYITINMDTNNESKQLYVYDHDNKTFKMLNYGSTKYLLDSGIFKYDSNTDRILFIPNEIKIGKSRQALKEIYFKDGGIRFSEDNLLSQEKEISFIRDGKSGTKDATYIKNNSLLQLWN